MKSAVYFSFFLFILTSCTSTDSEVVLYGEAQGTTYQVKYWKADSVRNFSAQIDSILKEVDSSLSTYLPNSIISRVNSQKSTVVDVKFKNVFTRSKDIYHLTEGAFDPSVMPLVNAWGFGPADVPTIDTSLIDSLKTLVGLSQFGIYFSMWRGENHVKRDTSYIMKTNKGNQLDFNGIAQGYTVDVIADFLAAQEIDNFLIEVGGEIRASGRRTDGELWNIQIDKPEKHARERESQATLTLDNTSIATSGNYRKFYELNGEIYSHTIDPVSGYPVTHSLLSASVVSKACMDADAYATAFMVMGLEKSKAFLERNPELNLQVYLIYADKNGKLLTYTSPGLEILPSKAL